MHGVDEAGRALRFRLYTYVEPYRRIEAHFLLHEQVGKVIGEGIAGCRRGEISADLAPIDNRVHNTADQLAHGALALRLVQLPVEILRSHDIGRRLRPGLGHFHVFLAEDNLPLFIANLGHAPLPFHSIKGRNASVAKITLKVQTNFRTGFGCGRSERRFVVLERHLGFRHLASAQVGFPRDGEPLYFTKRTSQPPGRSLRFSGGNRVIQESAYTGFETPKSEKGHPY